MSHRDPDADLCARAAAGDREAFASLLERHYTRLHRIACRILGTTADAEDVVQDVCCALVDRIAGFRGESRVSTWLTGILVNACRDHIRRRSAARRLRDRFAVVVGLAPLPDGRDLFVATWLASGLARLPAALREAFVLVAAEGLSHAEAAAALGVAEGTISARMHEARRRLRVELREEVADAR